MTDGLKKAALIAILGIVAGYLWLNNVNWNKSANSPSNYVSGSVPAPVQGQKKVALKNLGMT